MQNEVKNTVVFDLDGTLAIIEKRLLKAEATLPPGVALKNASHKEKDEYWAELLSSDNISLDEPNEPVVRVLKMHWDRGDTVVIFSGRSDRLKEETVLWLEEHGIPYSKLVMRDSLENHFKPDTALKMDWLGEHKYNGEFREAHVDKDKILVVYDDRDGVVKMWRQQGIPCFQVAEGNF